MFLAKLNVKVCVSFQVKQPNQLLTSTMTLVCVFYPEQTVGRRYTVV